MRLIDNHGTTGRGLYSRRHNPNIYVEGIRADQFNSKRIARRRPDLEKFDTDDLALIRYGYDLDFDGRMSSYGDTSIPLTVPVEWTVFWAPAYTEGFPYPHPNGRERKVLGGAWHFDNHGGPRHLGYRFGHMHATRHTGERLACVKKILLRYLPDLIETQVHVVRSIDAHRQSRTTIEYEGECAPLGDGRVTILENANGESMICASSRYAVPEGDLEDVL
jgi:hypothetical protein